MHIFYTPDIDSDVYSLSEEESKHCIRVLRLSKGAVISLIDGRGGLYTAEITSDSKKNVIVKVIDTVLNYQKEIIIFTLLSPQQKILIDWSGFLRKQQKLGLMKSLQLYVPDRNVKSLKMIG